VNLADAQGEYWEDWIEEKFRELRNSGEYNGNFSAAYDQVVSDFSDLFSESHDRVREVIRANMGEPDRTFWRAVVDHVWDEFTSYDAVQNVAEQFRDDWPEDEDEDEDDEAIAHCENAVCCDGCAASCGCEICREDRPYVFKAEAPAEVEAPAPAVVVAPIAEDLTDADLFG
jgi:hypothetical protein